MISLLVDWDASTLGDESPAMIVRNVSVGGNSILGTNVLATVRVPLDGVSDAQWFLVLDRAKHLFGRVLARHEIPTHSLIVHQDRGSPMTAHGFADLLNSLGVERSYSRPRVSNDNAFGESQFKTLKYWPSYPDRFRDADHAREWARDFFAAYNRRPHEGLALFSPEDVFTGQVDRLWVARQAALDAHYDRHPPGPTARALPIRSRALN